MKYAGIYILYVLLVYYYNTIILNIYIYITCLVGGIATPLKNDGVRQLG
jgi:hypothetical protein